MTTLFEFLNSINYTKEDILDNESDYTPFIINRGLSMNFDTVLFANEMNQRSYLDKRMQYDYLRLAVPKKKRYNKWSKKDQLSDDIRVISEYYKYNTERSIEALSLLSKDQLSEIRNRIDVGGRRNE